MGWLAGCEPTEVPPTPPPQRLSLSLVKDIDTSSDALARPRQFHTVGSTTFFTASDDAAGVELWKTDGTEAGTVRVKDVVPGPRTSQPWFLRSEGGNLFFSVQYSQLWKSDGTEAGTVFLHEDRAATWANVSPDALWSAGGWVYFRVRNHPEDLLFANDGRTPGSTQRVTSFPETKTGDRTQRTSLKGVAGSVNGSLFLDVQLYDSSATPQSRRQLWPVKEGKLSTLQLDMPPPDSYPPSVDGFAGHAVVGQTLFFAGHSSGMTELWRTDGTPAGTGRVKELVPYALTAVGGTLFFQAHDDQGGPWLWKSDGTEAGTVPVKALPPPGGRYTWMRDVGGTLFFLLDEGTSGLALWKSDGTEAGTARLMPLHRHPFHETVVGGQLFFILDEGSTGWALWRSDGTEAGTRRVKLFPSGQRPSELTAVGEVLFFRFDDGATGQEVWRSDGTEAGTRLLKDLAPGAASSEPSGLANANGTLLFTAQEGGTGPALWKSDGTEAGTVRVRAMQWPTRSAFGLGSTGESEPAFIHETLFFSTVKPDPPSADWLIELWTSDGTREGTVQTPVSMRINPRYYHSTLPSTQALGPLVNGTLFFQSAHGFWRTDGTAAGTQRALLPLPDARTDWLRTLDTGAIFYVHRSSTGLSELWATQGAGPDGQLLLSPASGLLMPLASRDGALLMLAPPMSSADPLELWRTDGTTAGTVLVKALDSPSYQHLSQVQRAEDKGVFFLGRTSNGVELWRTDGTEAGTVRLGWISNDYFHYPRLLEAGGRVFFVTKHKDSSTQQVREELWSTDGTVAGTVRVRVFEEGSPGALTTHAGKLYFWTVPPRDSGAPHLLWTSDGTEAGTLVLGRFARGVTDASGWCGKDWQNLSGALYFGADDGQTGLELWRTNGTPEGTVLVKDVVPGAESSGSRLLAVFADRLVFAASSPDHPNTDKVWVTDGTAEGTVLLQEEETGRTPFDPCNAAQVGSRLFFQASTPGEGRELWKLESHTSP